MSEKDAGNEIAFKIAQFLHSKEGTGPAFGIELNDVREGYAKISMIVRDDMLNGLRTAHGGMIFTLADTAFAYACNSRNVVTFAMHASITFLSPVKPGELLVAEAIEETMAKRTGVYTVTVFGDDGRRAAIFQGVSRTAGGELINTQSEN